MKKTILIAEKEGIIALDIQNILKKNGFSVCAKTVTINETMEYVEKKIPDLILINKIFQGEIDGIDAAKCIREKFNHPILFITSKCDSLTIKKMKKIVNSNFLFKPFSPIELIDKVNQMLNIKITSKIQNNFSRVNGSSSTSCIGT